MWRGKGVLRVRAFAIAFLAAASLQVGVRGEGTSIFDDTSLTPSTRPEPPITGTPAPVAPVRPPDPAPNPQIKPPIVPPVVPTNAPPVVADNLPRVKLAPPDAASAARVTKLVKQVFEKDYEAKTTAARSKLAGNLIAEADKIKRNFDARYVLLQEALTAGASAGDVQACRKSIAGLDQSFKFDSSTMALDVLSRLSTHGADNTALAGWTVELIEQRIKDEDYLGARKLIRPMSGTIARSNEQAHAAKLKSLESVIAEYDKVRPSIEKLRRNPSDEAANFLAGRFYCFVKHDWAKGLPLLAKGSDSKLKEVAVKDIANPADPKAQYALAGQWWDLGHDRAHASMQSHLHERAGFWYRQAAPGLDELEKTLAEKRMTDGPAAAKNEPSTLQLAGADIGKPAMAGSSTYDAATGTLTVNGGGKDLWSEIDELYFVSQRTSGDGTIIAQVKSQTATSPWARCGIMFRNESDAGSNYAAVFVTPGQGVLLQWGGRAAYSRKADGVRAPVWVKLIREGAKFTGSYSDDGQKWTEIGTANCPQINSKPLVGLVVCGHNETKVGSAAFANVALPRAQ